MEYNLECDLFPNIDDHNSFIEIAETLTNINNNINISPLIIQHIAEYSVGKIAKCANFRQCQIEEILLLKQYENINYYNNNDAYIFCEECMFELSYCQYPGCRQKDIKQMMITCHCRQRNAAGLKRKRMCDEPWNYDQNAFNVQHEYCRYHLDTKDVIKCKNINCDKLICTTKPSFNGDVIYREQLQPFILHRCQILCGICCNIVHQQYCSIKCGNNGLRICCNNDPKYGECNQYICNQCVIKYSCFGDNDGCNNIFCPQCQKHARSESFGFSSECEHCMKQICRWHADGEQVEKTPYYHCTKCKHGACSLCIDNIIKCKICGEKNCSNQYKICNDCNRKLCKTHMSQQNVSICNQCNECNDV